MRDTLSKFPGVSDVSVDFDKKQAVLKVDTDKTTPEKVAKGLAEETAGRYSATVLKKP